jgi:hypothetical protein
LKKRTLKIFLSFVLCFCLFLNSAYAAVDISLDPITGTIDQAGMNIDIVVDSGGGEVDGFEISIVYSGDIEYMGFTSGDVPGCTVEGLEREEQDDLFLYCFILADPYTGSDNIFASLNFRATGENGGTVRINTANAGTCQECGTVIGAQGNYTTSLTAAPQEEQLPQTNLLGVNSIFVGVGIISLAALLKTNIVFKRREKMMKKLKEESL